jgi:hypothetical protein
MVVLMDDSIPGQSLHENSGSPVTLAPIGATPSACEIHDSVVSDHAGNRMRKGPDEVGSYTC